MKCKNNCTYLVVVGRVARRAPKVGGRDHRGQRLIENHRLFLWSFATMDDRFVWPSATMDDRVDHVNRQLLMIILDLGNNHARMILFGFSCFIYLTASHIWHCKLAESVWVKECKNSWSLTHQMYCSHSFLSQSLHVNPSRACSPETAWEPLFQFLSGGCFRTLLSVSLEYVWEPFFGWH